MAYTSGGKRIRMQMWEARGKEGVAAPAVLVLHGAGVVDAGYRYLSQLARRLAGHGFHVFMAEYFDRTGTTSATDTTIKTHAAVWLETIHDAVDFIAAQPGVEPEGIGTLGYSLGGYLAVAHAAQDERIRAVVELAGGIDAETAAGAHRLPPLLIVHGREDPRVSFSNALELQGLAERLEAPVQTLFLPGERHILSPGAALVAVRQAMRFFDAHLKSSAVMC
ncbi:MAG: alpha/beta hydrolase family protein [Chthoniobacter sp.]